MIDSTRPAPGGWGSLHPKKASCAAPRARVSQHTRRAHQSTAGLRPGRLLLAAREGCMRGAAQPTPASVEDRRWPAAPMPQVLGKSSCVQDSSLKGPEQGGAEQCVCLCECRSRALPKRHATAVTRPPGVFTVSACCGLSQAVENHAWLRIRLCRTSHCARVPVCMRLPQWPAATLRGDRERERERLRQ